MKLPSWIQKILDLFKKDPKPEPEPAVHPRNDKSRPCSWEEAAGAPKVLAPGYKYRVAWTESETESGGVWRFEYEGGGEGLYKPHSWGLNGEIIDNNRLWLLPPRNPTNGAPLKISDISAISEVQPNGAIVGSTRPVMTGYFGDRIIVRQAKVSKSGNSLRCLDIYGQRLFFKTIADRDCRQD